MYEGMKVRMYVCMYVCVHVSECLRGALLHFVCVCFAVSVCTSFFTDGECAVHDHFRVYFLLSLTGVIMHSLRPFLPTLPE